MYHKRKLCPVGQGGFSIEMIENFTVAYDCGSTSSKNMVENCIVHLSSSVFDHIDILFISHFDKDHVNSIRHLLNSVTVKKVVTPMIPTDLKIAFNVYTNESYQTFFDLIDEFNGEVKIEEIGEEDAPKRYVYDTSHPIWEWIAKSMMTQNDFSNITTYLRNNGMDMTRLNDADYLELEKEKVNKAFKKVFGWKGPNSKGLVVLSQHCKGVATNNCDVWTGCCGHRRRQHLDYYKVSSCFYIGDADLKNRANNKALKVFLHDNMNETNLLLMQIPHHGSHHNIGVNFESDFPSKLYFLNDIDTSRLKKMPILYMSLTQNNRLLVVKDMCADMVNTAVNIR